MPMRADYWRHERLLAQAQRSVRRNAALRRVQRWARLMGGLG